MKDKDFERLCPEIEFGLNGHWKKRMPSLFQDEFAQKLLKHPKPYKPLFIPQKNEPRIKNYQTMAGR